MNISFHIEPAWQKPLAEIGLNNWNDFVTSRAGECLSRHERGQTSRIVLPNGQIIFLKIDNFTKFKTILYSLAHLRSPRSNTEHERDIYQILRADGFVVPEIIAWGTERRRGIPHRAFMVSLPIDGVALDLYLQQEKGFERREIAIRDCVKTLQRLQDHGYDWNRDCKPEHFFVLHNSGVGLIDLERAQKRRVVPHARRARQYQRFYSLLRRDFPDLPKTIFEYIPQSASD